MAANGPRRTGIAMRIPLSVFSHFTLPSSFSYIQLAPCLEIVARSTLGRLVTNGARLVTEKRARQSWLLVELFMPRHHRVRATFPCVLFAWWLAPLMILLSATSLCAQSAGRSANGTIFRNTDQTVAYVGSKTCGESGCHAEMYRDYQPTPHGQSMTLANTPSDLAR